MKISVILPTYRLNNSNELDNLHNYGNYNLKDIDTEFARLYNKYVIGCNHILEPTIECLHNQSFSDFEIILCHKHPEDVQHFKDIRIVKEKPSLWHELGDYATVNNIRNTGIIHARGELLFFLDDMTIFNENLLQNVWNNYEVGYYTTCKSIKRIKVENDKIIGNRKINSILGSIIPNSMSWTYGMSVSLEDTLNINGFDEIYDGSFGGTDMDFGRRLSQVSYHQRKVGSTIYEFTHYSEQKKRKKIRDDEILRRICGQSPNPIHIKANSWKPTKVEYNRYENWHMKNMLNVDSNWDKFMDVSLYNLKDEI